MSSQRWKRQEREVAAELGGTRVPNQGKGAPDVLCERFAVQVKTIKALPIWLTAAVDQAARDAGEKLPLVILNQVSQGRKARRLIVLDVATWAKVAGDMAQGGPREHPDHLPRLRHAGLTAPARRPRPGRRAAPL